MNYVSGMKTTRRIDTKLLHQYNRVINCWKNVLKMIVAELKFLAQEVLFFVVIMIY